MPSHGWKPSEVVCNRAYDFIVEHVRKMTYPPTMREIADELGYASVGSVAQIITQMEELGWIVRSQDRRRLIRLTRGDR